MFTVFAKMFTAQVRRPFELLVGQRLPWQVSSGQQSDSSA
jgi:hypothetical protein